MHDKKNHKPRSNTNLPIILERARRQGAEFFVDGEAVHPKTALCKAVEENSIYMVDYICDAFGHFEQVHLDKVDLL